MILEDGQRRLKKTRRGGKKGEKRDGRTARERRGKVPTWNNSNLAKIFRDW